MKQWRCFFCDAVFTRRADAALHFGVEEADTPACALRDHEHHLIIYIRKLEAENRRYRAEDSDVMRALYTQACEHNREVRDAEEKGYEKGLRDGRALKEEV